MKIIPRILLAAVLLSASTSCEKFLDINTNPNNFRDANVTPDVILATALSATARNYTGANPSYNSYASWVAGYWTKTNVVSGYGEEQTYNYSTSFYAGLFDNTYDNLNDYNVIQQKGTGTEFARHAAIARIMKAYNFLLLVDEYGDIPYSQALQGAANKAPVYDKAQDIYKDLLVQLTGAIADVNTAVANQLVRPVGSEDIVFQGNMTKWKQFANSLKLRILLRESQTGNATIDADVRTQLTALRTATDGFITADVVVQPGYAQNTDQQNPLYDRYAYTPAGTAATERNYQIATQFIINQYEQNADPRLSQLYTRGQRLVSGTATPMYVGGVLGEPTPPGFNAPTATTPTASRFLGANSLTASGGIFKGVGAPTPLMLLAEHLFNRAEVETRGLWGAKDNATAKTNFLDGIKASFIYFYRPATTTLTEINASTLASVTTANGPGIAQYNTFIATTTGTGTNVSNPKVNFDAAIDNATLGKQEIIIFQKYLALNSIASVEAWDDYRRTGKPVFPASIQSTSPRPDKLPTRLLYPLSEVSTNLSNVPQGVTQYSKIFWDVVD